MTCTLQIHPDRQIIHKRLRPHYFFWGSPLPIPALADDERERRRRRGDIMEVTLSGNALKTFARSITCLSRVGSELAIQASPSQLALHTLNSSHSAYQSITFKPGFFDVYTITGNQVECSVLLKAICSVLRTPLANIDHLSIELPDPDASKVQWTLECYNGMRKAYWITCNVEPSIQHLTLDRRRFPSKLVVRPRDLNRLLANFQSSLQEITVIATEPTSFPSDAASEIGGKAVELRSYIDPTKDNDSSLHTQLWIDPVEEFVQYTHSGDPVDVTLGVKELKAFLTFCEGCEVDIQLYFEKAGEPVLMAPKFGLDDGSTSNFDATLVLATMLVSQLHESNPSEPPQAAAGMHVQVANSTGSQGQGRPRVNVSEHPSDHTRIWSDLSGSATKSGNGADGRDAQGETIPNANERREIPRISTMYISKAAPNRENESVDPNSCIFLTGDMSGHPVEKNHLEEPQDRSQINGHGSSQRHPSNWVDADEDDDDGEDPELCVQSTPPYYEEQ